MRSEVRRPDMKCQTCGNDNAENAQFCGGCGASLSSGRVAARPGLPTVGFGEAISRGFTNYFTFSGRASRPEYWWWVLFTFLLGLIPLAGLVTLIPTLAVTSRRLHDIGKTGWWQLLFWIISIIAWSASISFLFLGLYASEEGDSSGFLFLLSGVALVVAIAGAKLPGLYFKNQRVEAAYRKELVYGEDHADRAQPPTGCAC